MSFLGDIVSSINSERPPPPPPPSVVQRPANANAIRPNKDASKPNSRPGTPGSSLTANGVKRKAESDANIEVNRGNRPNTLSGSTNSTLSRPADFTRAIRLDAVDTKVVRSVPTAKPATASAATPSTIPGKSPSRGSYADLVARAKARLEQSAQTPQASPAVVKNPPQSKDKRLSKLAERRRRRQETQKGDKTTLSRWTSSRDGAGRGKSPVKPEKDRKVAVRPPAPPMHGPPRPSYKGTMGSSSGRTAPHSDKKGRRYDDYLGTDEEEEDGYSYGEDEGDEGGYDSAASSDMEAGASDIEREEALALRAAKNDDASELAIEQRLKREKEERRKRLLAMSKKQK